MLIIVALLVPVDSSKMLHQTPYASYSIHPLSCPRVNHLHHAHDANVHVMIQPRLAPQVALVLRLDVEEDMFELLGVFVKTTQIISQTVRDAGKGDVGAEDLLPLLAWVLHRAKPRHLPARLRLCECLMSFSQSNGLEGYAVGSASIAASHVVQLASADDATAVNDS